MSDKPHISQVPRGKGVTQASGSEEQQSSAASLEKRALTDQLMEAVCDRTNLNQAYKRVVRNKGCPGVDRLSTEELLSWLQQHGENVVQSLLSGTYRPQAVKGVEIPKPAGGMRHLSIPTVLDRFVQQAILQVLDPILDSEFSESSYGFRRGRSAQEAVEQASRYVQEGYNTVVDMDLDKFFDRVNHDILMSRLSRVIGDKRLLKIIGRFLRAGIMTEGVCFPRTEGTPQGGPLSPLLSNFLLNELDKELERRGHKFCRYADDCNVYVRSQSAGERVLQSLTSFLWKRLRLKVNETKSAVDQPDNRKFLGYRILSDGRIDISREAQARLRSRVRHITKRNSGKSFASVLERLNLLLRGWINYFYLCDYGQRARDLDRWVRRRLRCFRIKQCKRRWTIYQFLQSRGVSKQRAWTVARLRYGWWKLSLHPATHKAMSLKWFKELGLVSMQNQQDKLKLRRNRRDTRSVCQVV